MTDWTRSTKPGPPNASACRAHGLPGHGLLNHGLLNHGLLNHGGPGRHSLTE